MWQINWRLEEIGTFTLYWYWEILVDKAVVDYENSLYTTTFVIHTHYNAQYHYYYVS